MKIGGHQNFMNYQKYLFNFTRLSLLTYVLLLGFSMPVRASVTDFDGDGKSDISVFRPSDGFWHVLKSSGGSLSVKWGLGTDALVPGDYDGDGKTDFAVYRRGVFPYPIGGFELSKSHWYILRSSDNAFFTKQWGDSSLFGIDLPSPSDDDGDGRTDIAVYRREDTPASNTFRILQSSNGTEVNRQWGFNSDRIATADYDGDGKADYAVYRNGTWFILQSSNGALRVEYFGFNTDKIVPGDFDGDGKADLAVFRPANGFWYVLSSRDNSIKSIQFGLADDKPTPGDYDGDGKTDVAVFRPSNGVWYLQQSTSGFRVERFGFSNDVPLPNVFVR